MQLKKITMHNIRSYVNHSLEFPTGSVLLSGDIGAGKSSILLATEFALFGAKSSELPGASLLRHGKTDGFVELQFEIEGKHVVIKRTLKRGRAGVKQESGYLIVDDQKEELSPIEMKSRVFELLGYPRDLVSKSKDLIYRFTVYTPQEEMKRILFEDKDTRLNTLRKLFNIDKYKRIKENTAIFTRSLREKQREYAGAIADTETKKKELESVEKEITEGTSKIQVILPRIEASKRSLGVKKQTVLQFEQQMTHLTQLKNELKIADTELRSKLHEHEQNNQRINSLNEQIKSSETELQKETDLDEETLKKSMTGIEQNIGTKRKEIDQQKEKMSEATVVKSKSYEIINKIVNIEECPLCLQHVSSEHKTRINETEQDTIKKADEHIKLHLQKINEDEMKLKAFEKELDSLRKQEGALQIKKIKQKQLAEKRQEYQTLKERQIMVKKSIGTINSTKLDLTKQVESFKELETQFQNAKTQLDEALQEEKTFAVEKARLEKEQESLERMRTNLKEELAKKETMRKKLVDLTSIQQWLESYFVQLLGTMEKHVMVQVQREFSALFTDWFSTLIEDESLNVRIDEEFTPIIEQNGYETTVQNLSGGEKTAVALAYRLALNKVINDIISEIKTKDILMLDEPTDGFSSEQLDKVRDVLNQLKISQVIIVSHESKIESFVEHVIRIGKESHQSGIV